MTVANDKLQELEELRARLRTLEAEVQSEAERTHWAPQGFYAEYYATTGFLLGMFGAAMSLVVNVVGAPVVGKSPLELIRVYLTFPLGESALQLGDSIILAIGCCLYLGTGMLLGVPFFVALVRLTDGKSFGYRMFISTLLAIAMWVVNFYGILSWLQPLLLGGRWITDPHVLPPWVALVTHLVFGWTLALLYPWGKFQPYQQPITPQTRDGSR